MNKTKKQLIDKITFYADSHRMFECTDIVIGYSGGADSSLLLYALAEIARERSIRLYTAHINHMLRGGDADADEEFCRRTSERMGIPFFSGRFNVRAMARGSGQSEEECARDVRYGFFSEIKGRIESERADARVRIAVAHNATDNAETVLFHLARGSGIRGMCGIPPVRDGYIIRPILPISKEQVLLYCSRLGVEYVTDATNEQTVYTRNRIRHNILPELREINPSLEAAVLRLTESLREDAGYLDHEAEEIYASLCQKSGEPLVREKLLGLSAPLRTRVLARYLDDNRAGYEYTHIDSALRLAERGGDFSLSLIGRVRLVCKGGVLRVETDTRERELAPEEWEIILSEGENILPSGAKIFMYSEKSKLEEIKIQNIYNLFIQQTLCGDTINNVFRARCRREGDVIFSGGHTHKLKKLYSDKKIPLSERHALPVVERDGDVVWIPDVRLADGEGRGERKIHIAYCI